MADRDEVRINNVYRSPAAEHDIISPWLNIQTFNAYSWRTVAMALQETAITLDEKNRTQIESKTNLQNTTSSIRTSEFVVQEDGSGITVEVVDAVVKVGDVEYENQVKSCIEIIVDIATTHSTHNKTNATNLLLFYFGVVFAAYFCNSLCTQSVFAIAEHMHEKTPWNDTNNSNNKRRKEMKERKIAGKNNGSTFNRVNAS